MRGKRVVESASDEAGEPKGGATADTGRQRRRRRGRRIAWSCGIVLVLLIAVVVGIGVRLMLAPIGIAMAAREAQSILQTLVGAEGKASVGTASLSWRSERGIVLELDGIRLEGPTGVAEVPAIVIDIDADALVLTRQVRVHALIIERPSVALAPLKPGEMGQPEPIELLENIDERLGRVALVAAENGVELIEIRDGSVRLDRPEPLPALALQDVDVRAEASASGTVEVRAEASVGSGRWTGMVSRGVTPAGTRFAASIDGIGVAEVMGTKLVSENLVVGAGINGEFGGDGRATAASLTVNVGPGSIAVRNAPPIELARAQANIVWRPQSNDFALNPSPLEFDGWQLLIAGTLTAPSATDPLWRFQLTMPRAILAPPDVPGPPLEMESASADGTFDPRSIVITLDRVDLKAPVGTAEASGRIVLGPGGPKVRILATLTSPTDFATFIRVWPRPVVPPARTWVLQNVLGGRMVTGVIDVDLGPLDLDPYPMTSEPGQPPANIRFGFEDASLKMVGTLPPLTAAAGEGRVFGPTLAVDVTRAILAPSVGGDVTVSPAKVTVDELRIQPLVTTTTATLAGSAAALAALANAEPMRAMAALKIDPGTLSGETRADLSVHGPMDARLDTNQLTWTLNATLRDVGSSSPIDGHRIADADLSVTADKVAMTVKGTAVIDGIKANIDIVQPSGGAPAQRGVTFTLSEKELSAQAPDLRGILRGSISVVVADAGPDGQSIEIDLTKASVTIPGIGWTKGAGVAAQARFRMIGRDGAKDIRDFSFESEGVRVAGGLTLDAKGGLATASFGTFSLRPGDSASVELKRGSGGGYAITVRGARLDGRGLIKQMGGGGDKGGKDQPAVAIDLDAQLERLIGYNGTEIDGLRVKGRLQGSGVRSLTASGRVGGGDLQVALKPDGDVRTLSVTAGNAGGLLRFLDYYGKMRGGRANVEARISETASQGRASIREFQITEDPKLSRLIETAAQSPGGRNGRSGGSSGGTVPASATSFDRLTVDFRMSGGVLTIEDAVLRGPGSGGTATGTIRLDTGRISISGTYIPIFAINNLFGRIPVLGEILGGGRDGGLFGITFKLDGPMADPALSFNPISSITPGIFRRIFEYQ
jgi:hypothetical protein